MKKFFLIFLLVFSLFLFVSCVEDEDEWEDTEYSGDTTPSDTGYNPDPSDTGDTGSADCGNHTVEDGEVCDGGAKECTAIDTGYTGGYASCRTDCSGWDTRECQGTPVNPEPTDPTTDPTNPTTDPTTDPTNPTTDPTTDPTTPVECTGFSIVPESFTYDPLTYTYHADISDILGDESLKDELRFEFPASDPVAKSYDLDSYNNQNYHTCTECVRVFQDIQNGTPKKQFFQKGGTLNIEKTDSTHGIKGSLKTELIEVTINTDNEGDHSVPVTNGACFEIESILFDNLCVPNCENKVCGDNGCGGTCDPGCSGDDMVCNEDQTGCIEYTCDKVTVDTLTAKTIKPNLKRYYYESTYTPGTGDPSISDNLWFRIKYVDGMHTRNFAETSWEDCADDEQAEGTVCIKIFEDGSAKRYFPNKGTIDVSSLNTTNGTLNAAISNVRLVEVTESGAVVPNGKCIEIMNETLSYTAQ